MYYNVFQYIVIYYKGCFAFASVCKCLCAFVGVHCTYSSFVVCTELCATNDEWVQQTGANDEWVQQTGANDEWVQQTGANDNIILLFRLLLFV